MMEENFWSMVNRLERLDAEHDKRNRAWQSAFCRDSFDSMEAKELEAKADEAYKEWWDLREKIAGRIVEEASGRVDMRMARKMAGWEKDELATVLASDRWQKEYGKEREGAV